MSNFCQHKFQEVKTVIKCSNGSDQVTYGFECELCSKVIDEQLVKVDKKYLCELKKLPKGILSDEQRTFIANKVLEFVDFDLLLDKCPSQIDLSAVNRQISTKEKIVREKVDSLASRRKYLEKRINEKKIKKDKIEAAEVRLEKSQIVINNIQNKINTLHMLKSRLIADSNNYNKKLFINIPSTNLKYALILTATNVRKFFGKLGIDFITTETKQNLIRISKKTVLFEGYEPGVSEKKISLIGNVVIEPNNLNLVAVMDENNTYTIYERYTGLKVWYKQTTFTLINVYNQHFSDQENVKHFKCTVAKELVRDL